MTKDRLNFRCSGALRRKLEEAATRSKVSLSEQVRRSLMEAYEVEDDQIWLPSRLRNESRPAATALLTAKKTVSS